MNQLGWLQAEKELRMDDIRQELTLGQTEYMDLLDEYVLLIREKLE
jgi:hypothetical protein